jgi:hypothetical protein
MTQELFRVRCKQGQLIITDEYIRTELPFSAQQHTLYRAALTGVEQAIVKPAYTGPHSRMQLCRRTHRHLRLCAIHITPHCSLIAGMCLRPGQLVIFKSLETGADG